MLDAKGGSVNAAAAKMLGWNVDGLIGQPMRRARHHSRPDGSPYPATQCRICAAGKDNKVDHVEDEVLW
jgi:hypothetical protein